MLPNLPAEPPPGLLGQSALFLDFDGTLVNLAPSPDAIRPDPELPNLLTRLDGLLQGRLALVSGRSVADLARWLPDYRGFIAGSHGAELRWPDGRIEAPQRPAMLDAALLQAREFAAEYPGVTVEDKSLGVGLHYRPVPQHEAGVQAFAAQLAEQHGLALQHGKMVAELRSTGFDKGTALRRLMGLAVFRSAFPVFMGDDLTDMPAMAVATELRGYAIVVGDLDCAHARYRFADVARALGWLKLECTP